LAKRFQNNSYNKQNKTNKQTALLLPSVEIEKAAFVSRIRVVPARVGSDIGWCQDLRAFLQFLRVMGQQRARLKLDNHFPQHPFQFITH
jgi:hypothetical protein